MLTCFVPTSLPRFLTRTAFSRSLCRQSRNRHIGEEIGRGRKLSEVLVETPEVAEGARTCLAVPRLAAQAGVEVPIADAVVQVLYEGVPARDAVEGLMTRALRAE